MKPKKKELKPGDVIPVKSEHQKFLEELVRSEKSYNHVLAAISEMIKDANKTIWEFVNEKYPELKDYICGLDTSAMEIQVHYKKESVIRREVREAGKH